MVDFTSFIHSDSFEKNGNKKTVDNKAWGIFASNSDFTDGFTPCHHFLICFIRCFISSDYLQKKKQEDTAGSLLKFHFGYFLRFYLSKWNFLHFCSNKLTLV